MLAGWCHRMMLATTVESFGAVRVGRVLVDPPIHPGWRAKENPPYEGPTLTPNAVIAKKNPPEQNSRRIIILDDNNLPTPSYSPSLPPPP